MQRYSLDIYRSDEAILIHDGPGGWKRGLLLSVTFGFFMSFPFFVILSEVPRNIEWSRAIPAILFFGTLGWLPVFSFVFIFLFSLWRISGHEMILIDREKIRIDWWCFWDHRSKVYICRSVRSEINHRERKSVNGSSRRSTGFWRNIVPFQQTAMNNQAEQHEPNAIYWLEMRLACRSCLPQVFVFLGFRMRTRRHLIQR